VQCAGGDSVKEGIGAINAEKEARFDIRERHTAMKCSIATGR
jgi:hypothetical protein